MACDMVTYKVSFLVLLGLRGLHCSSTMAAQTWMNL